mgnify:FL=1
MKKQIITTLCVSALLVSSAAIAATTSKSFGGFTINVNTPTTQTKTTTPQQSQRAKTLSANQTAMKNQINSIVNTATSASKTYESAVNGLSTALLPANKQKELAAQKAKIKQVSKDALTVNIDVAENGAITLTNYLNTSEAKKNLKNMSSSQKSAVRTNLNKLATVDSTYTKLISQSKTLAEQVANDPTAAILMSSEFKKLKTVRTETVKQTKNIAKLTSAVAKSTGIK